MTAVRLLPVMNNPRPHFQNHLAREAKQSGRCFFYYGVCVFVCASAVHFLPRLLRSARAIFPRPKLLSFPHGRTAAQQRAERAGEGRRPALREQTDRIWLINPGKVQKSTYLLRRPRC